MFVSRPQAEKSKSVQRGQARHADAEDPADRLDLVLLVREVRRRAEGPQVVQAERDETPSSSPAAVREARRRTRSADASA